MTYQININKINPTTITNSNTEVLNSIYYDVNSDQAWESVLGINIIRNSTGMIFEFPTQQHYTFWLLKYS